MSFLFNLEKIDFSPENMDQLLKIHREFKKIQPDFPYIGQYIKVIKQQFIDSNVDWDNTPQKQIYQIIGKTISNHKAVSGINMPATQDEFIAYIIEINSQIFSLGPLDALLRDDDITDIMVHSWDNISITKRSKLGIHKYNDKFADEDQMKSILTNVLSRYSKTQVDMAHPIGDGVLSNGERIVVVIPPIAPSGTVCIIRKQSKYSFTPEMLQKKFNSFTQQVSDFLELSVKTECNIVIVGATGSGKTALASALLNYIPTDSHLLTIEDTMELQIPPTHSIVTQYKTRINEESPNTNITIYSLLRAALRSNPNYIIVGETRGAEAWEMLQAMKSGHAGITTIHAHDGPDAISRLEGMMALADNKMDTEYIRRDIAQVMNLLVIQRWIGREDLGTVRRGIYAIYEISPTLEEENILLEDSMPNSTALTRTKIFKENPRFVQTYGSATLRKLFYYNYDEDKIVPGVLPSDELLAKYKESGFEKEINKIFNLGDI